MASRLALFLLPAAITAWQPPFNALAVGDIDDCSSVIDILDSCSAAIPTITAATNGEAAGCFCCDRSGWDPDVLGSPASSCYSYFSKNVPTSTALIEGELLFPPTPLAPLD